MSNNTQTLEMERCQGTKQEWVVYIDSSKYPTLTTVSGQIAQFKKDLSDWLTANNEWGNLHVVSELPYAPCVLLHCDAPVAQKLATSLSGIQQLQEWIEK